MSRRRTLAFTAGEARKAAGTLPHARPNRAESGVVVIEDDRDVREALKSFLQSTGLPTEAYGSVEAFRTTVALFRLVVWSSMSGYLAKRGSTFKPSWPSETWICPSSSSAVTPTFPMCVRAMKAGAIEFLTKPVHHEVLLNAIHFAIGEEALRVNRSYSTAAHE